MKSEGRWEWLPWRISSRLKDYSYGKTILHDIKSQEHILLHAINTFTTIQIP